MYDMSKLREECKVECLYILTLIPINDLIKCVNDLMVYLFLIKYGLWCYHVNRGCNC